MKKLRKLILIINVVVSIIVIVFNYIKEKRKEALDEIYEEK